ncbi:secreted protein [Tepidicaulis marinus]|uniref:Secreted protein n=1 Tax=Tepidicaulis marinus TaxID=1333998 RepID=A0A081BF39_9HYPH|nr:hypothetical protein [Tepidicaulis marinus]GAK46657.1 secreted protein [Tepidicaulis marinus]
MRMLKAIFFAGMLIFPLGATAQEAPKLPGSVQDYSTETVDNGEVRLADNLPVEGPARATSFFQDIADGVGGQAMKRVRMIGTAQPNRTGQGGAWSVEWTALMVEGADLPPERLRFPLSTQFDPNANEVQKGYPVPVAGKFPEAIEDAMAMLEKLPKPEEDDEGEDGEDGQDGDSLGGSGKTGEGGNDQLANFQPPEVVKEPEQQTSVTETFEGCEPRVSETEGVAIVQGRLITLVDGVESERSECSDTSQRLPLKTTREGCSVAVAREEGRAYQEARKYYTWQGNNTFVTDCERYVDVTGEYLFYQLVEEKNACPILTSLEQLSATVQAETVYYDDRERRTVVAPCLPTEETFPVTFTTDGCSIRHDFDDDLSTQQHRAIYTDDEGVERNVAGCVDSPTTYAMQMDYGVCEDAYNAEQGVVIRQGRKFITVNGSPQHISGCLPGVELGVTKTRMGCEGQFDHDLAAGLSYIHHRFFYEPDGVRSYLTSCERTGETAGHNLEQVGWENDDAARSALPVAQTYIDGPEGRVNVGSPAVNENESPVPYVFVRNADVLNGQEEYVGCNVYKLTDRSSIYRRPDGSEAIYANGAGASQGPTNGCTYSSENRTIYAYTQWDSEDSRQRGYYFGAGCSSHPNSCPYNQFWDYLPSSRQVTGLSSYSACITLSYALRMTHFDRNQSRQVTQLPDGSKQYGAWTNQGSPFVRATYFCPVVQ